MSRMKHLLRKLHIGGGLNEHQRLAEARPVISPSPSPSPNSTNVTGPGTGTTTSSSSSSVSSGTMGRIGTVESVGGDRTAGDEVDFNLLEEEFQMQLALAISASDPETAQIDAAKRISLAGTDTNAFVELLSLRYWNYNVVNYAEKIVDGFYDVYGIASTLGVEGKMPSLVDLQAVSVLDNVDYEVILVNRLLDPELQELEKRVYNLYVQSRAFGRGPVLSGMIQKIAEIVVNRMGGPVADAEDMLRMWTSRSYELRNSLNSIILPLGRLDVGLSRHRALLFKVLADRINLPCMLVKGSYYTGTDDGAVNLVRINNESEYIIDLMGAPGTLIPAEVPSCHLLNSALDVRDFADVSEASQCSYLLLDKGFRNVEASAALDTGPKVGATRSAELVCSQTNEDERNLAGRVVCERSEQEFGKLLPSAPKSSEVFSGIHEKTSSAQKRKVKNVSKYVISAAKDPEFAQKLHAVLLESGASPPPDLFMDINSQDIGEQSMHEQVVKGTNADATASCQSNELSSNEHCLVPPGMESLENTNSNLRQKQMAKHQRELETNTIKTNVASSSDASNEGFLLVGSTTNDWIQVREPSFCSAAEFCQIQPENVLAAVEKLIQRTSDTDFSKESALELIETTDSDLHLVSNGHSEKVYPMLREVSEWEIQWEDLQIGDRIGIGSYGEVYRADWNGTEVAVKKFLDQDFSGDALVQFKCEVEIMLRLRHPNVVLFMGAVTRSPHFSILTEFLPRGSLYKLLHRPNPQLDEKRRMRMALDVAKGMNYLHTSHPTIVHRDLKTPNLLVDKNWVVKVCDFGLSRMKHHTFLSSKSTAGTPEWMAPEVLRNEPANEKCDVYSFGVILWELVTLRIPWKGLNPMQVVGAVGFQNRRLEIPEDVDPTVAQIIHECWQTEPHLRPSFAQLMSRLRHLQHLYIERPNSTNQIIG
ncbi:probable serine/threonine-protein kinase SIS8 isoform X2 [Durio zibethinus]|uniref:non-specific serine/threonine protein kinase n=1 Tax=Durio zibethinus TaxID=66656 RepID=A0A6P5XY44_DURZI|nr:probable serine/threonine-protein kinase SIS8 isoform X2 [Durio zibethinus]